MDTNNPGALIACFGRGAHCKKDETPKPSRKLSERSKRSKRRTEDSKKEGSKTRKKK